MPKQKLKKETVEYRLLIDRYYDETLRKNGIRFFLETVKQFSSFNYSIDIEDSEDKKLLQWKLHGLCAPGMQMPSHGAASTTRIYYALNTSFTFFASKNDGRDETLKIKILKNTITVSDPQHSWLKVYTDEQEFESQRTLDREIPPQKHETHKKSKTYKNSQS